MQRPINKDYYYIDFHATIDAIKYRMFHLTKKVEEIYKPSQEKKDYFCPQCKAQWTKLEVLDKTGPMGFECHRCGGILEREEPRAGDTSGNEMQSRLMSQLDRFIRMLQQIEDQQIPNNDFDTAMTLAVPVPRDSSFNPLRPTAPIELEKQPAAVKGMTQAISVPLDVSVTTNTERSAADHAAETKRKADIASQNALPIWHTTSTVTGQKTVADNKGLEAQLQGTNMLKAEENEKKDSDIMNSELEAYYAQMLIAKANEAREDQEESSAEDDEEFEDVAVEQSMADTSSSLPSMGANGTAGFPDDKSGKSNKDAAPANSHPVTDDTSTPADLELAVEREDGRATKKVKFEDVEKGIEGKSTGATENISDEDDDAEFEDV